MAFHLTVISSIFLGAFVFSFAGFGFAIATVPLLSLVLPIKQAVALQFPFGLCLVCYNTFRYGRQVKLRSLWPLIVGGGLFVPLGLASLNHFPESLMKKALAVFIIISLFAGHVRWPRKPKVENGPAVFSGLFMGAVSGWFHGAYTTGGPPAVLYIKSAMPEPDQVKGALALFFAFQWIEAAVLYGGTGMITGELLLKCLLYSPALMVGVVSGSLLFRRVRSRDYFFGVDALLLATSILMLVRS